MPNTRLLDIDVDQLEPDPANVRSEYDPEIIRDLATFFKDQGTFIENPVVWKVGELRDGRPLYRAFSGSTRAQAARSVGGKITVQILQEAPEGAGKVLGQLAAGLVRGDLNPIDIGRALKDIQQRGQKSVQDLVRELADWGMRRSRSWVFQHLHLADMTPEVQGMVARGEVPIAAVNVLHNKTAEEQLRIASAVRDGSLRLSELAGSGAESPESIQGDINRRLTEAGSASGTAISNGRHMIPADHRHGGVQSRRLLTAVDEPERFCRQRFGDRLVQASVPGAWVDSASEEDLALAREALHLGKLSPEQAIEAVSQWQAEAQTAPDDLLMAAHGMKRLIDLYTRSSAALSQYPGLLSLLALRASALAHIAHRVEKQHARL